MPTWGQYLTTLTDPDSELKHVQTTVLSDIASLKGHLTRPREERTTRIMCVYRSSLMMFH
jgi:hypothetical protein